MAVKVRELLALSDMEKLFTERFSVGVVVRKFAEPPHPANVSSKHIAETAVKNLLIENIFKNHPFHYFDLDTYRLT